MSIFIPGEFLRLGRGFNVADGGGVTWSFDKATNTLSISALSGSGLANDSVTNAILANMAQATIKGRASGAGTGDPTDLTAAQVKTILALAAADISDFNEAAQDAVLAASADSASVDITYNDAGNAWHADVICANPTGTIGLSAVNGTAATPMRSDAAPALSQAIVPTWSGKHTFQTDVELNSADTILFFHETDATTNQKRWQLRANSSIFRLATRTDADAAGANALAVSRTGTTISQIEYANSPDNPPHTFNGHLKITDGVSAPSTVAGYAAIYVDSADGDLKVKFGDGTVKTIVVDT